ncbi:pseudouridine synthase [Shewanella sp. NIFS-20-20]|uniref:pseudouridine synthase n=1 Tax=Shewanella sp. NIFS-20-20 TaxID=2853806 RepID=UPI001C43A27D|nr:pseudouridine synthase [Shewanella sp. NIFS-20-20]MBV7314457.1 pseudouridine synthase [Shewanella sp. NIFS-20-20]
MQCKRGRLDRLLAKHFQLPRKQVRLLLLTHQVSVDGTIVTDMDFQVDEFMHVACQGQKISGDCPRYYMLNKPVGVVSATIDDEHQTVLELLPAALRDGLHIVGRLDLNTSGMILLTNDSRWSEALMTPNAHVAKRYQVTLKHPVTVEYQRAFQAGMYFNFEDITTLPAQLIIHSGHQVEVILREGKYHQIKRMFGHFRNQVLALHRSQIGALVLDPALAPSQWRALTPQEVAGARVSLTGDDHQIASKFDG